MSNATSETDTFIGLGEVTEVTYDTWSCYLTGMDRYVGLYERCDDGPASARDTQPYDMFTTTRSLL